MTLRCRRVPVLRATAIGSFLGRDESGTFEVGDAIVDDVVDDVPLPTANLIHGCPGMFDDVEQSLGQFGFREQFQVHI